MRRLTLLLLAVPLAAQQAPAARDRLLESDRAASEAVASHGVYLGLPAHLADDVVLVWPGAAVLQGSSAISRFLRGQRSVVLARISWQPLHLELAADSTLALEWGVATVDRVASATLPATHRIGRFLAAWKPIDGRWQLSALAFSSLQNGGETVWVDSLGLREWPLLRSSGPVGKFIAADSSFAARAGNAGVANAFSRWAAPDAVTFSASGELAMGRAAIAAGFAGDANHWSWGAAVAAGASTDGSLGWTVGQAVIVGKDRYSKSKYLTLWRRLPNGGVRYFSDGGNGKPSCAPGRSGGRDRHL